MMSHCVVRWNDGSHDNARKCVDCGLTDCKYPVYKDYYKEVITKKTYWDYLDTKEVRLRETSHSRVNVQQVREPDVANPDNLADDEEDLNG